uniref:Uncharacterized protein n=1 Tax=Rhizophora mucronata TaxID=61149 RepID=A0A2P2PXV0_RHIMU
MPDRLLHIRIVENKIEDKCDKVSKNWERNHQLYSFWLIIVLVPRHYNICV